MQLLELRANKSSFHTVRFKPSGISIIAAIKETNDQKKTYNSVGKSLTISIIHFCLGSNQNKEFEEKLPDWIFTLDFKVGKKIFSASRSTGNQKEIILNDVVFTLDNFKKTLEKEVFLLPENSKFISFRGLISRFIRQSKHSYVSYDTYIKDEDKNPIVQLINTAFLLGLDIQLILKKGELKEKFDNIAKLKSQLANPEFKLLFEAENEKDVEIKIVDYETKITKLKNNLSEFKVAEDYYIIKKEADEISYRLSGIKNKASKLKIAISNIDKSLEIQPDISKEKIIELFNEANVQLANSIIKRLEEVEYFNSKLLNNRTEKLLSERRSFELQLDDLNVEINSNGRLLNDKLQYLNSHGALEEYTQLNRQLADIEKKLGKLLQYKKLVSEYKQKNEEIKQDFSTENIRTNKYLDTAEATIKSNIALFKSFSEEFYRDKASGISVENNDRVNTIRFDINAKIEDDTGDAVNEVKIFCFDWTILKGQHNHKVKFLFHDSRITDGIDTRQVKTMFEIASKECKKNNFQYIVSLNQNVIDSLKDEMTDEQHKSLVGDNVILTLSDKSPDDKLLGIQLDLDYEK